MVAAERLPPQTGARVAGVAVERLMPHAHAVRAGVPLKRPRPKPMAICRRPRRPAPHIRLVHQIRIRAVVSVHHRLVFPCHLNQRAGVHHPAIGDEVRAVAVESRRPGGVELEANRVAENGMLAGLKRGELTSGGGSRTNIPGCRPIQDRSRKP